MSALCIECTHSSLRGVEPQTQLVCQCHDWIVVSTDTCTEFEPLRGKRQGIRGVFQLANRLPGTMWEGLDRDQRPEQWPSSHPFLTLRELLALPVAR